MAFAMYMKRKTGFGARNKMKTSFTKSLSKTNNPGDSVLKIIKDI